MEINYVPENLEQVNQQTRYGDYGYGSYIYPKDIDNDMDYNYLPEQVSYFNYKVINSSAYFLETFITREKKHFTKIELSWNDVKGALAYAIYKGSSSQSLKYYTISKENLWYETDVSDSKVFYQIRPLFSQETEV